MAGGIIITLLVVSAFLIGKNSSTQTEKTQHPFVPGQPKPTPPYQPQTPNSDPTQKPNPTQTKVFVNLIKEDLKIRIKELADNNNLDRRVFGIRDDGSIVYFTSEEMEKNGMTSIFDEKADYFEQVDYQEIVTLICQLQALQKKKESEWEKDLNKKLAGNKNLFCYGSIGSSGKPGAKDYHQFWGKLSGLDFILDIPVGHPALTNIKPVFQDRKRPLSTLYLIKGFVFPTQKYYHEYSNSYFYEEHIEDIELADGITINRVDFT